MASGERSVVLARLESFFGVDDGWERAPDDPVRARRVDVAVAAAFTALGLVGVEILRSIGQLQELRVPTVLPYAVTAAGTTLLAWRRRWPLAVTVALSLHMFAAGVTMPVVMGSIPMQVTYFFAIFTGVAWARDRRLMLVVIGGVLVGMFGWLTWQLAVGSGVDDLLLRSGTPSTRTGLLSPTAAYVLYLLVVNIVYFGGAVIGGQVAWRSARQRQRLGEQAATIEAQAVELRRQAVVEERLRIARELHDVVAHHVSVIGIQAAAARRVLRRDPEVAERSLQAVEQSSREAVGQMRELLGTLRTEPERADDAGRSPEPGLADVPELVAAASAPGLTASCAVVEDRPGSLGGVPPPIGLSLYRTVQEALANVRRHSTAAHAEVVVRVDHRASGAFPHGFAEVEVLDEGRPRQGTSGTGLGLLGVRERLATHGGRGEIGPRVTGGYRVRVRLPLPQDCP